MLRDIAGFRGNRAIEIQDNHAFWKRVLMAYGNDAMKKFQLLEESQQQARLKRIRSAPVLGKKENDKPNRRRDEKLLPKRCQSGKILRCFTGKKRPWGQKLVDPPGRNPEIVSITITKAFLSFISSNLQEILQFHYLASNFRQAGSSV